jgi:hypothetical protein
MPVTMRPTRRFRVVVLGNACLVLAACLCLALYEVTDRGAWPSDWPKELEPLRASSRTLEHSSYAIHEIHFTSREDFEKAWPHLVGLKSQGAPIILHASPYKRLGNIQAGVRILAPLTGTLVTLDGARHPPGAGSVVPGGKFARIGPPWPDSIKNASGVLPLYVVYRNGTWEAVPEPDGKDRNLRRARLDIELVVDGTIVDLNRIALPAGTPIVDRRFEGGRRD